MDDGYTHDTSHTCDDLGENRGCHGFGVTSSVGGDTETVNDSFLATDIATGSTERLRECAHEDINLMGIDAEVITDTTTMGANSTN